MTEILPGSDNTPTSAPTIAPTGGGRSGRAQTAFLVLVFLLAGHIWSLNTGLFLDDHAHYANLRAGDWSLRSAAAASHLGIVGEVMDLWGRPKAGLDFFRPVAFWIMKAEYTLVGWRPGWMHGFSLGWHYACALLVGALAFHCFGQRSWATVAACLMAAHPAHTATVYWIACQTELITTAFLLAGVLAYARHAGWDQQDGPWLLIGLGQPEETNRAVPPTSRVGKQSPGPLPGLLSVCCYALALGCRENAVLFPLVCWAGDRLFAARRRRFGWVHAAMIAVLGAYLVLRSKILGGFDMPVRPYVFPISEPGFAAFIVTKIVYYTLGLFGFVPVVPMGGQAFFATRPVMFYGGFTAILLLLAAIWAAYRFRGALLWPVIWIGLLITPVLPVFASSHHLYLPGVGATLLLTAGLAAMAGVTQRGGAPSRGRKILAGVVLSLTAAGLPLMTWAGGFAYAAGTRTEDALVQDVIGRSGPIQDGDHLFFINMPLLAYYAIPAVEAQTGRCRLQGHVLTFSPDLLKMEHPGEIEVLNDRQIRVRAPAGRAYFEGVTGQALLEVLGLPPLIVQEGAKDHGLVEGRSMPAGLFTVTPTRMGSGGVEEFVFTFAPPIDTAGYHFYFGSPQFPAYPLGVLRRR